MNLKKLTICTSTAMAALLSIFGVWFYNAPHAALISIRQAATRGDTTALNELVDFPSVRASLKILLTDLVAKQVGQGSVAGGIVARVAANFVVGSALDALLTPSSIALMFSGVLPQIGSENRALEKTKLEKYVHTTKVWDGLSTMRVHIQSNHDPSTRVTLVMRRDGLSWRLSAVER